MKINFTYINNVAKDIGEIKFLPELGIYWDYSGVKIYKIKPTFCIFFAFLWFTINLWINNGQEISGRE